MPLINCKECKKEVSAEARNCPYCGIEGPGSNELGINDKKNRLIGFFVLSLLIFLCAYIFTRHGRETYQIAEIAGLSKDKEADLAKAFQHADAIRLPSEHPKTRETPVKGALAQAQIPLVATKPQLPVIQETAKQNKAGRDKNKGTSFADPAQTLVMRMLEYALKNGGLSRESEIQQVKIQIKDLPRPEKSENKVARKINAKGLASLKAVDFNNAVKMFEEANRLAGSDVEIINNLGFAYLKKGDLALAQQAITKALTLSPGRATAWENLGEVFGRKGDPSYAAACFANAYRFSMDRLKMHRHMNKLNEKEELDNLKSIFGLYPKTFSAFKISALE